jgi:hypothetical protein
MRGDGGPIIRSSPTKIVSSIVGCESTEAHKTPQQIHENNIVICSKAIFPLG